MPFGLCGAPATFQRLMDMIMSGLNFEICLVYLDDIIVFSETLERHLERLVLMLDRIRASGLKIKASKTHLLQRFVDFLGHVISYRGIEPQQEKVTSVLNWPRPESAKEIKAFLGLCGYYRRFVEGFAEIAAPLYELLRKGRKFEWTGRCDESFERLKTSLTSAPILGVPNDDDPFVFNMDVSDEATGAKRPNGCYHFRKLKIIIKPKKTCTLQDESCNQLFVSSSTSDTRVRVHYHDRPCSIKVAQVSARVN
jgi:Reverse transcriptase (RNA-dependent DNA polymerase)/RNase H-like domain found in reverse transcriptase